MIQALVIFKNNQVQLAVPKMIEVPLPYFVKK